MDRRTAIKSMLVALAAVALPLPTVGKEADYIFNPTGALENYKGFWIWWRDFKPLPHTRAFAGRFVAIRPGTWETLQVPCVYTEVDVMRNSHDGGAALIAQIKENGLLSTRFMLKEFTALSPEEQRVKIEALQSSGDDDEDCAHG